MAGARKKKEQVREADGRPRLSAHPRARRQIAEAKAWAAIVAFVLVGLLSMQGGAPLFDAGLRALGAGLAAYVAAWGIVVAVWRQLARAEVRVAEERWLAERETPSADVAA